MKKSILKKEQISSCDYQSRTSKYYLEKIESHILESFNPEQIQAITFALEQAISKSSPKLVDLRFVVDLIFFRFYIVLFIGKDRRKKQRKYTPEGIAKVGNIIAAVILLIGINLVFSAFILLLAYLFKSAIGIDLFSGHISETLNKFIK